MVQQIKWFDRKFEFNQPIAMLPLTLDRLRGAIVRLTFYTSNLPESILTKKEGNAWSIQEHVGHLIDLEELHEVRIDDFLAGKETLRAADLQNRKTHEANHNNADIHELLKRFAEGRIRLIKRLEGLSDEVLNRRALHPRLNQQIRPGDLAVFVAEHDDQHLATIYGMINSK